MSKSPAINEPHAFQDLSILEIFVSPNLQNCLPAIPSFRITIKVRALQYAQGEA
jgi:hypothetical protein